ncbi:pseudaminic acid cytidylyltransferase, partial [Acinetobacter bereziniae]|nr:pseudaminic acid cytidylyltransferase [Acinetobacter bereziniae]
MNLAVIPARGGSKRIPHKNIKFFLGKPMIAWSIEAALSSGIFDEVWVSTDDIEIAEISKRYGAKVPFIRPDKISDDFSTTADVMAHAVGYYKNEFLNIPDLVCCIYATAPFIS